MIKLILVAAALYIFFRKMPRTRKLAEQKLNQARGEFSSRAPEVKDQMFVAADRVKEEGRGILIRLLVFVIGVLSSILSMLLSGVASSSNTTDIERR